jgi:hypothetical protein
MATNGGSPREELCARPNRRRNVPPSMVRLCLGGLAGTLANALIMFFFEPGISGRGSGLGRFLGAELSNPHGVGILVFHLFNGSIIFPLGFGFFAARLRFPWLVKGLIWGVILWLAAGLIVMPMSGFGPFGYNADGWRIVVTSLAGHLVYGALQGLIAGIPGRQDD